MGNGMILLNNLLNKNNRQAYDSLHHSRILTPHDELYHNGLFCMWNACKSNQLDHYLHSVGMNDMIRNQIANKKQTQDKSFLSKVLMI